MCNCGAGRERASAPFLSAPPASPPPGKPGPTRGRDRGGLLAPAAPERSRLRAAAYSGTGTVFAICANKASACSERRSQWATLGFIATRCASTGTVSRLTSSGVQ